MSRRTKNILKISFGYIFFSKKLTLEGSFYSPAYIFYLEWWACCVEFDVGVYFEANGHGTVVFSETAQGLIKVRNRANFFV